MEAAETVTASYATPEQARAWLAHLPDLDLPGDDEALAALLERASADVDLFLGWPVPLTPGVRIDPTTVSPFAADRLARATAQQAGYRRVVGELDLVEGEPRVSAVEGVTLNRRAPDLVSPQAIAMLADAGLLRRSGTAAPTLDAAPSDAA